MSIQCMVWALKQQEITDASARHVLLCLANYAGEDGRAAFPSASTLAVDTGLSERTVRSKLDLLESSGAIKRGNQAIVAAYIERADKRPVCYDIVMTQTAKPGAATAPRDDERGANGAATGCKWRSNGVQSTHERGAAIAGNTSFNPSFNPSVNPKDYADPSGTADLFAEPPANSASRADKKAKPDAFDALAFLLAAGVDEQVAHDWLTVRKKKSLPPTLTAFKGLEREGGKLGLTFAQTVTYCAEKGWAGFYRDSYVKDTQPAQAIQQRGYQSKQDRIDAENARNRAEREARLGISQPVANVTPPHALLPNNNVQDVEFYDAR